MDLRLELAAPEELQLAWLKPGAERVAPFEGEEALGGERRELPR